MKLWMDVMRDIEHVLGDYERLSSTPLADVLPVTLEKPDYQSGPRGAVRLTSAGASHPLPSLTADRVLNGQLWKEMVSLDAINLVKPKGSASWMSWSSSTPKVRRMCVGMSVYSKSGWFAALEPRM